jgi:CheY-like chemotaxis protein
MLGPEDAASVAQAALVDMNELLIWIMVVALAAVVVLLLWLGRRRQQRARDAAEHREAQRMALEQAEHVARAQRLAAERDEASAPAGQSEAAPFEPPATDAEAARLAEEVRQRADDEAARAAEQARAKEAAEVEAAHVAAEAQAREEAERLAREQAEHEAAERAAREAAEAERLAAEARAREEAQRLAREQAEREAAAHAAEAARLAAEAQAARDAEAAVAAAVAVEAPTRELRADETLVLVADDSKIVRVKLSRLLAAQGYRAALAESGEQALELMAAERPHLLITDVEMPGIDGFELTRVVRAAADTAALPVVMITGSDDKQEEARAAGVTQLLGKPYSEEALIATIEAARLAVRVPA